MHLSPILVVFVVLTITNATIASAQDERLITPQPEHGLLERLAGEWQFERLSVPTDGSDVQTLGSGTISAEMVGAFFVVSRWSGEQYGFDYEAVQTLGFNIEREQYAGHWADSFMSYSWELSGSVDQESRELTLTTSGPGPTGDTMAFRERYRFESAESITIFGEMQQGDDWVTISTTRLTRRR